MSNNLNFQTIEFDLPVGFKDANGVVHKHITMRRMKTIDRLNLQKDLRIKDLAGQRVESDSGNAAQAIIANAVALKVYAIIFSLVVTAIDGIPKENILPEIFYDIFDEPADMKCLMDHHKQLNGDAEGGTDSPFPQGTK